VRGEGLAHWQRNNGGHIRLFYHEEKKVVMPRRETAHLDGQLDKQVYSFTDALSLKHAAIKRGAERVTDRKLRG
jgi:hypothetical protein